MIHVIKNTLIEALKFQSKIRKQYIGLTEVSMEKIRGKWVVSYK
jgi:hypothetical protein